MPTFSSLIARITRILRNLSRILLRRHLSTHSSKLPTTVRNRQSISSYRLLCFFIPFLSAIFFLLLHLFRQKVLHTHPSNKHLSIPRAYDPSSIGRLSTSTTPLQIIIVVPPFTNASRLYSYQDDDDLQTAHHSLSNHSQSTSVYSSSALDTFLTSINTAHYDNDPADLQIVLAPHANSNSFIETYSQCSKFKWLHGNSKIRNASTGGLFDLGVSVWSPPPADQNHALLLDASRIISVSPNYYRYLKSVRRRYADAADIAGFTLEPVLIRRQTGSLGQLSQKLSSQSIAGKDLDTTLTAEEKSGMVFFYQALPMIGAFSPVDAQVWRAFQRWFAAHRSEWFLWPTVVAPKDKKDPTWNNHRGTLRAHWTLWFSRFCAEYGLYTVYPLKRRPEPVPPVGKASAVLPPPRFDFRGKKVIEKPRGSLENLDRIVELGKRGGGSVSLTIISEAFLETARSWICNVDVANIRPPSVVWITTDDVSYETLRQVPNSYAIKMSEFKGGQASTGTSFGTPGYWLLMLERTQLVQDILQRGVGVFLFETDQIWLRDPVPFVQRLVHSGDEVDIVGTLDTRHEIGGNFLFLNPTLATRRLWQEVTRRFEKSYRDNRISRRYRHKHKYIENDQSTLTKLVFFDGAFKAKNPVVFRTLDTERFVDGRWYNGRAKSTKEPFYFSKISQSPIVINNNFLIGIASKKQRAIENDHWFLTEGKCNVERVKKAIRENEEREAANTDQSILSSFSQLGAYIEGSNHNSTNVNDDKSSSTSKAGVSRMEGTDEEAGLDAAIEAMERERG